MSEYALLKKISAKTVVGKIKMLVPENDDEVRNIMEVIGVAVGTRKGTSNFGDWVALRGQFMAHDLIKGGQYRSGQCFLPDEVTDQIATQLTVEGCQSVEFGFMIGIKKNETAVAYEYVCRPLMPVQENDAVALLAHKLKVGKEEPPVPDLAVKKSNGGKSKK